MTMGSKSDIPAGKVTVRTCLYVVMSAVAMVMAGTGNLEALRMLRHLRTWQDPGYGVYGCADTLCVCVCDFCVCFLFFFGGGGGGI